MMDIKSLFYKYSKLHNSIKTVVKWLSKHQKPNIKLDLLKKKTLNFM